MTFLYQIVSEVQTDSKKIVNNDIQVGCRMLESKASWKISFETPAMDRMTEY